MNFDHLHLLLNHVPIIGFVIALALFVASFAGRSLDLRRSALIIFTVVALLTIPTFVSGVAADRAIANEAGISEALVKRHEGAAMLGLWFVIATGGAAMTALWRFRRTAAGPPRADIVAVLLLSTIATGLMARTGNTGGEIRHPQPGSVQGSPVVEGSVGAIETQSALRGRFGQCGSGFTYISVGNCSFGLRVVSYKLGYYPAGGVQDYWVVELVYCCLIVFRDPVADASQPHGAVYRQRQSLDASASVSPLAASRSSIAISSLLP